MRLFSQIQHISLSNIINITVIELPESTTLPYETEPIPEIIYDVDEPIPTDIVEYDVDDSTEPTPPEPTPPEPTPPEPTPPEPTPPDTGDKIHIGPVLRDREKLLYSCGIDSCFKLYPNKDY